MTITAIITADPSQPVEVQTWLDAHPDISVQKMMVNENIFYVLY